MAKFTPDETGTKALWAEGESREGRVAGKFGGVGCWRRSGTGMGWGEEKGVVAGVGVGGGGSDDKGVVLD